MVDFENLYTSLKEKNCCICKTSCNLTLQTYLIGYKKVGLNFSLAQILVTHEKIGNLGTTKNLGHFANFR